jgi:hypothetical protein
MDDGTASAGCQQLAISQLNGEPDFRTVDDRLSMEPDYIYFRTV